MRWVKTGITVLVLALTLAPTYALEEEPVTIVIHKRLYVDPGGNTSYKNNSGLIDSLGDGSYGLNGVEFTIYDLSDYISQSKEDYDTLAQRISNQSMDSLIGLGESEGYLVDKLETTTQEGESGVAKILVNGNYNQAYLILETKSPKVNGSYEVIHKATPMLVVLPVEHPINKDTLLSTVHIYPKTFGYVPEVLPQVPDKEVHPPTGVSRNSLMPAYVIIGVGLLVLILNKGKNSKEKNNENKEKIK